MRVGGPPATNTATSARPSARCSGPRRSDTACTFAVGTDVASGHIGLPIPGVEHVAQPYKFNEGFNEDEEAFAAREPGVVGVADDLDRAREQHHARAAAPVGQWLDGAPELGKPPAEHLAPAGLQRETELGVGRVDLASTHAEGHVGNGEQREGEEAGKESLHGHQNSVSRATPGSTAASIGNDSTAMPPGGMPR